MIDPTIEKALTKQEWKDGVFVGKTIAFLTSAALAWGLLIICLAVIYVMLKMPPLAPQTELPKTANVAPVQNQFVEPTKKVVKPMVKKSEVKPVAEDYSVTEKQAVTIEDTPPSKTLSTREEAYENRLNKFDLKGEK